MHPWRIHVMWEVDLTDQCKFTLVSSCVYLELVNLQSLQELLSYALSLGLSKIPSTGMTSPISVPGRQPDMSVQYHPWSKVHIREQHPNPIQLVRLQGLDHLRANSRFGVFWFILPLLAVDYHQPTSFREDFLSLSGVSMGCFRQGSQLWDDY